MQYFKACIFVFSLIWVPYGFSADPFEDFHQYGEVSDDEIHKLHVGDLLYGDVEFGLIANKGNSQNTAFKLKSNVYQDFTLWRNQFKIDALYREDTDSDTGHNEVTASRYFVAAQGNYKVGQDNESFFIYGDYSNDKFSGKDYTTTVAIGYGNRLFEGRKNTVDFDIGPGLYLSRTDEKTTLAKGQSRLQQGHLLRLALQWERSISKRTRFNHDMSMEISLSGLNDRMVSETAIVSQVLGGVSLKVSYTYRYNSQPEEGKLKTDTELGATLVYSF
ncbi:DUF481 domain-containing protein [Pseudoalteromonas byunsanensis]|uniref:DUF481 domain-containing protein n=1 Tax=Pseudoalteromonas byunsanensis TaxID=327939 RepID=A0A1S1N619_9GAMM|nr:DUF481 domain-containing protein [Pseudoalteromonas byunsanensis]OHU94897.1 hypothetical protein BIW53_12815 [Pseudoalteromonas byunsanensis]